ncbi:MAG: cyclic pyranopterin monophosphate synthase MoaC [Elusimicrobia bacterium]|nr:cyclic pyranopterin monophosphate synthase MoaC [Elusimicrobiota bacterium]
MKTLTHLDSNGNARMVDVGSKPVSARKAIAYGEVRMSPEVLRQIRDREVPKGDVMAVAKIAGIMAAKRVDELIPLCHSLNLDSVDLTFESKPDRLCVQATVCTQGRTGVEMEALTAVSVACLTIYDMAKAVDKEMLIGPIYLVEKEGGRSGHFIRGRDL